MTFMSPPLVTSNLPYYESSRVGGMGGQGGQGDQGGGDTGEEEGHASRADWLSYPAQVHFLPTADGNPVLSIESSPLQATLFLSSILGSLQSTESTESTESADSTAEEVGALLRLGRMLGLSGRQPHTGEEEGGGDQQHPSSTLPNTMGDYVLNEDLDSVLNSLFHASSSSPHSASSSALSLDTLTFSPTKYRESFRLEECVITQSPLIEV